MLKFLLTFFSFSLLFISPSCIKVKEAPAQPTPKPYLGSHTHAVKPKSVGRTSNIPSNFRSSSGSYVSHGSRQKNYLALTFDDGPHPIHTPRLLDILKSRNIKATFFVLGSLVKRYPDIARRIVREGHEIGNHTWDHPNLKYLSNRLVSSQLERTRNIIGSITGAQPRTMRPPYGSLSSTQREWIFRRYGYPSVMWDVDPQDWKKPGTFAVTRRLVNGARNGSILLLHDIHKGSVDAVPNTISQLLNKGFQFVTISQLITAKKSL